MVGWAPTQKSDLGALERHCMYVPWVNWGVNTDSCEDNGQRKSRRRVGYLRFRKIGSEFVKRSSYSANSRAFFQREERRKEGRGKVLRSCWRRRRRRRRWKKVGSCRRTVGSRWPVVGGGRSTKGMRKGMKRRQQLLLLLLLLLSGPSSIPPPLPPQIQFSPPLFSVVRDLAPKGEVITAAIEGKGESV